MKFLKWLKSLFEFTEEDRIKLYEAEQSLKQSMIQLERIKRATILLEKSNQTSDPKIREIYRSESAKFKKEFDYYENLNR